MNKIKPSDSPTKRKPRKASKPKLNPTQELFCKLYISADFFGNGSQAYIEAYGVDITKSGAYQAARVSASRLLTNANILSRIDKLLELAGLNDQFVDRQLTFWMTQKAEGSTAMKAITEYNKLKKRVSNGLLDDATDVTLVVRRYLPEKMPGSVYAEYMKDK